MRAHTAPTGTVPRLCLDILDQPHTLIAGATGSGKSVLINDLIYTALFSPPCDKQFILIDPKRVELRSYRKLPYTLIYASEPADMVSAINKAVDIMERRYKRMTRRGEKQSREPHIYIIVDEFADLMTTLKRQTVPALCRLAQLGRAANIHLILATQRPTKDIVTGQIKVNIDARVALRCPTAQDSRNIINTTGAEQLPRHGFCYYLTPDTMQPVKVAVPWIPENEINKLIQYRR